MFVTRGRGGCRALCRAWSVRCHAPQRNAEEAHLITTFAYHLLARTVLMSGLWLEHWQKRASACSSMSTQKLTCGEKISTRISTTSIKMRRVTVSYLFLSTTLEMSGQTTNANQPKRVRLAITPNTFCRHGSTTREYLGCVRRWATYLLRGRHRPN